MIAARNAGGRAAARRKKGTQRNLEEDFEFDADQEEAATFIQRFRRGNKDDVKKMRERRRAQDFITHRLASFNDVYGYMGPSTPGMTSKRKFYLLLDDPQSSKSAQAMSLFILATILVSITAFILQTMPELFWVNKQVWMLIETASTMVFTFEYVTRFMVCSEGGQTKFGFVKAPLNIFDLCAILPFYIEWALKVFGPGDSRSDAQVLKVLRIVRLIRLFRIFKLGRYSSGMRLMAEALKQSVQALWVLVFLLCVGVVLFSSMMYYAEKISCPGELTAQESVRYAQECNIPSNMGYSPSFGLCCTRDAPDAFPSIFEGFWWSIVTMTTVGYGDLYPRTFWGKLVGACAMLVGMVLIALPVAIVGQKFQDVYDNQDDAVVKSTRAAPGVKTEPKFVMAPHTDVVLRLEDMKVRDPLLAEKVSDLMLFARELWDGRGMLMEERKEEQVRQMNIQYNLRKFASGVRNELRDEAW